MAQATAMLTGVDAGELPAAFCATTTTLRVLPELSPVKVHEDEALWHWVPLLATTK